MAQWNFRWNFNKGLYQPGENGNISFWLENIGESYIYAEKAWLNFDWQGNQAYYVDCKSQIGPNGSAYLGYINFNIPQMKTGILTYSVGLDIWEYNSYAQSWSKLDTWWTKPDHFIKSIPSPFYRTFVSRGIKPEDRVIGDPIVEMIKNWGFEATTVGIDKLTNTEQTDEAVRQEISSCECMIAIATRRYLDALKGLWRTLEWLHGETGIAYGLNKPLLILTEENLLLEGLPGYLVDQKKIPSITFNPLDLGAFQQKLDTVLPSFREWIASKKSDEFWNTLTKAALIFIFGAIFGSAIGSSKK